MVVGASCDRSSYVQSKGEKRKNYTHRQHTPPKMDANLPKFTQFFHLIKGSGAFLNHDDAPPPLCLSLHVGLFPEPNKLQNHTLLTPPDGSHFIFCAATFNTAFFLAKVPRVTQAEFCPLCALWSPCLQTCWSHIIFCNKIFCLRTCANQRKKFKCESGCLRFCPAKKPPSTGAQWR